VAISVADTGTGMSEEVKERVFEPFFTTKEAGRGTGLGLSTVYGFVQQSRGAIGIDSAPGKGCVLTLYIPQRGESDRQAAEPARHAAGLPPGLKLLLVEDDAEVRAVVRRYLLDLGCDVVEAASAEEALNKLAQAPDMDILLTDIALGPGMRGTELAAQVQRHSPSLRVLLMSGYSADLLEADRTSPPAWELLRKPYSREELAAAMSRVLGSA
jgi:CheY-like chemotaxis protein